MRGMERDWTRPVRSSGDESLTDLYSAHASSAARLAYFLTGDQQVVDDIVQEAFTRVGGRILTLRDPSNAAGYLYRTVANLAKDHGRGIRRQGNLHSRVGGADHRTQPDVESRDEMWQALMKLSVRHRTALFLRYYMDLSEHDAAQVLDLSIPAFKSLTHRAAASLRAHLGELSP